jgi:ATP-dependent Clp protease adaptor protein ClpS
MSDVTTKPRTKVRLKTERPRLHKVILLNDDYTPREFVVTVLKGEFRMSEDQAYRVMMTAHRRGVCVVAVYTRDVAETRPRAERKPAAARAIHSNLPPSRRNKVPPPAAVRRRWHATLLAIEKNSNLTRA